MNDTERERDRQLRAQIDPLIGELTAIGKIELAGRLIMEGARDYAAGARTVTGYARAELPRRIGELDDPKRDSGGEESS